jgi:drug/metabolite transporter (DMT)-like permease
MALAYGAVLLDEKVTLAAIVGLVLILAGVALASGLREAGEEDRPPEPA